MMEEDRGKLNRCLAPDLCAWCGQDMTNGRYMNGCTGNHRSYCTHCYEPALRGAPPLYERLVALEKRLRVSTEEPPSSEETAEQISERRARADFFLGAENENKPAPSEDDELEAIRKDDPDGLHMSAETILCNKKILRDKLREDEGEKWGELLWRIRDRLDVFDWQPWNSPDIHNSVRDVWRQIAISFHGECVAPWKRLAEHYLDKARTDSSGPSGDPTRPQNCVFADWGYKPDAVGCMHPSRGASAECRSGNCLLLKAGSVTTEVALHDQVEPPEDPGHDAIRSDPARVDEHGMVETGNDEPEAYYPGLSAEECRRRGLVVSSAEAKPRVSDGKMATMHNTFCRDVCKCLAPAFCKNRCKCVKLIRAVRAKLEECCR